MLTTLAILVGLALIGLVLVDAFETMILPRSVIQGFRLTRLFYRSTWQPWAAVGRRLEDAVRRERFLGVFGPLSLLGLLSLWALALIVAFGLLQWGLGVRPDAPRGWAGLAEAVYFSGTTFFTLGLGDVEPKTAAARVTAVAEAGLGFGFLALVIGYLPVVYQSFSSREVFITRLAVRAGSPPSAGELLRQYRHGANAQGLEDLLHDCEQWAAELLESHLSYPMLCLYRSQHRDQSWLAALTTILDTCALLVVGVEGLESKQAPMTFAMARRAIIDTAHIFQFPEASRPDRLPAEDLQRLRELLAQGDAPLRDGAEADRRLVDLRRTYEGHAHALGEFVHMPLPPWLPDAPPEEADCTGEPPTSFADRLTSVEDGATDPAVV